MDDSTWKATKKIIFDKDGLVMYSYRTLNEDQLKYGYKIYSDSSKTTLQAEASGFDSEDECDRECDRKLMQMGE
jgi:hypothetical protein